jgi:hypothetical protein
VNYWLQKQYVRTAETKIKDIMGLICEHLASLEEQIHLASQIYLLVVMTG